MFMTCANTSDQRTVLNAKRYKYTHHMHIIHTYGIARITDARLKILCPQL